MSENEKWNDVEGYEGIYKISTFGNVKELKDGEWVDKKRTKTIDGYWTVWLKKNGKGRSFMVHRLVAVSFIPRHKNKPIVHHKDENKSNPNVYNLQWVDREENAKLGTVIQRILSSTKNTFNSKTQDERELNRAINAATKYCLTIDQLMIIKKKIGERISELEGDKNG